MTLRISSADPRLVANVIAHLVIWTILALEWQEVMPRIAVRILIDPGSFVGSQYYRDKFSGLANLFAGGCEMVDIETPNLGEALTHKVERAWVHAERWREPLLRAARMQIERGKAAYRHLGTVVDARRAASSSRVDLRSRPLPVVDDENVRRLAPVSGSGRDWIAKD